ncbi:hypothetical protein PPSIR1_31753 [Plesiocystis pacifica SIR-1]|uniref:Protein BatD n=1 Tax=Plesiocystis pacifica SIR-1 TaxID=391625 RepID=A6G2R8_9BACT|nr:hypothetical protein [Plesiocystis pacifica]EDM79768.1 hypothetical protein PPSIR1_31753 [Plesiocystis pacifica SIR-1]
MTGGITLQVALAGLLALAPTEETGETGEAIAAETDTGTETGLESGTETGAELGTETGAELGTETGAELDDAPPPVAAAPAPTAAPDSPLTVTTRLTPEPSHIGDLLTYEIIVAFPADHSVNLPSGLDLSPLERVDVASGEVEPTGQDLRQRFTMTLQVFELGELEVPSFPITWIDPQGEVHTHMVPAHAFEVEALLANEAEPERLGEDPPISLEYPNIRLATILYGVLAGVVLAGLLALLWLRWTRRERPVVLPPPIPPHVVAREALDTLAAERDGLIEAGAYQEYYLRLTDIAKSYLGARFGFEALDRTTEEIEDILAQGGVPLDPLDPRVVLDFLQDCDLVKFARLSPPAEEAHEALEVVRGMVERSTPVAGPASPEAEGASEVVVGTGVVIEDIPPRAEPPLPAEPEVKPEAPDAKSPDVESPDAKSEETP